MFKQFFVAHGVEGIAMAIGQDAAGFVKQSLLHHQSHSGIDAGKEVVTLAPQTDFQNAEGTLFFTPTRKEV